MKKYNSFIELTEAFAGREGTALEYLTEDGNIGSVSYKELAEKIKGRAAFYATKGPGTDYVYAKLISSSSMLLRRGATERCSSSHPAPQAGAKL